VGSFAGGQLLMLVVIAVVRLGPRAA